MVKSYTKKQFLEDVAKEAKALKRHATKEELENLELNDLDPNHYQTCVFGQMTGDCRNERAAKLIHLCCKRYFKNDEDYIERPSDMTLSNLKKIVNGKNIGGVHSAEELCELRETSVEYFSSIEAYILTQFAKTQNLIAYLKGERNDLVL